VLARAIYGREAERLIRIGYPAVGQYKYEWASRIAPFMQLEQNQSPSFQKFLKKLNRIMNKQEQRFVKIQ
jgi:succinyl-CoA synthetase beta subunit